MLEDNFDLFDDNLFTDNDRVGATTTTLTKDKKIVTDKTPSDEILILKEIKLIRTVKNTITGKVEEHCLKSYKVGTTEQERNRVLVNAIKTARTLGDCYITEVYYKVIKIVDKKM